ncbi:hypothetical protein D3C72_2344950 [compost metagenome]
MAILSQVTFASFIKTQLIIASGTIVNKPLTTLNVVNAAPVSALSILSLATMTNEVAPCSKLMKKKIRKNAKSTTANILSRTVLS